jgi:hypothetical protein
MSAVTLIHTRLHLASSAGRRLSERNHRFSPQHRRDARLNCFELREQLFDELLLQSFSLVTVDVRPIAASC